MNSWKIFKTFLLSMLIVLGTLSSATFAQDTGDEATLWSNWSGDVFIGYNMSSGNTDKAAGSIKAQALKKFEKSQFLLKGSLLYSESNKMMDGQKWDILTKFSHDFGQDDNWFSTTQVLVDHDYFSDIDYRITPSSGLGYHIAKSNSWIWDVDAGLGYRISRHRVNTAADDEALTAIVHTFAKKQILEKAFLAEDFTVYPGLKSDSGVLVRSETAFTNSLTTNLDLELKYILDYNSQPAADKKKTDTQIIAGLKYKF